MLGGGDLRLRGGSSRRRQQSHGCTARRIRSSGSRWAAHVACMGEKRLCLESLKERNRLEVHGGKGSDIEGVGCGRV